MAWSSVTVSGVLPSASIVKMTMNSPVKTNFAKVQVEGKERKSAGLTIIASANPKAKPLLYELLEKPSIKEYHRNIFLMLGYIGDEGDVGKLRKWLSEHDGRKIDEAEFSSILALFESLATMARRDIDPAEEYLAELTSPDYWQKIGVSAPIQNAIVGDRTADLMLLYALPAYASSGANDWKRRVESYLQQIDDDRLKTYMVGQLDVKRMERFRSEKMQPTYPEIPESTLAYLEHLFNGNMDEPSRSSLLPDVEATSTPPRETEESGTQAQKGRPDIRPLKEDDGISGDSLRELAQEAVDEFEAISTLVQRRAPGVELRLLDDGEPVSKVVRDVRDSNELAEGLAVEQRILTAVKRVATTTTDFRVRHLIECSFDSLEDPTGQESIRVYRSVAIVSFRLEGSDAVEQELLQDHRGSSTVDHDGALIVLMKKIDGTWYWNPFGW